ncbi:MULTISPECIES: hypothetical protein [unclassified Arenibacter]|jgi:hypothetical protein|uniref:hypothetical protein n=1 Tax=unclassified Arenibacter TaxID=2615047 RepID=UPI000E3572EE|nr:MULTISPECIES: hypothetical protein [unclassified Arenibacter]MCM4163943.1 hypothetical protein [Arenibacter sp. A80]RFT56645.1 hypothetical protein D0S24_10055 [Arenibacter sp. P308M17]
MGNDYLELCVINNSTYNGAVTYQEWKDAQVLIHGVHYQFEIRNILYLMKGAKAGLVLKEVPEKE